MMPTAHRKRGDCGRHVELVDEIVRQGKWPGFAWRECHAICLFEAFMLFQEGSSGISVRALP